MATLKKYNFAGEQLGEIEIESKFLEAEAHGQLIKDYIVALRANARQWSANTKGRSEVNHTTKKPHPQKGGGRARQGSLAAPQYKGGGRVFAPKPKFDQHVKINRKERKAAIRCLLAEKMKANQVSIIDTLSLEAPKTKTIAGFLKSREFQGRVLFLAEGSYQSFEIGDESFVFNTSSDQYAPFALSVRNLKKAAFKLASNVNGYDLLLAKNIVMTESALNELNEWLY